MRLIRIGFDRSGAGFQSVYIAAGLPDAICYARNERVAAVCGAGDNVNIQRLVVDDSVRENADRLRADHLGFLVIRRGDAFNRLVAEGDLHVKITAHAELTGFVGASLERERFLLGSCTHAQHQCADRQKRENLFFHLG